MFSAYYTTFGCPSWIFHSKYDVAPLPSDVYDLIKTNKIKIKNFNKIRFDVGKPATPIEHACALLPPEGYEYLPEKYKILIEEFPEYFPKEYKVNALNGSKYRYSDPMIKKIDYPQFFARVRELESK
jgi:5'-3' exonuclease